MFCYSLNADQMIANKDYLLKIDKKDAKLLTICAAA